MQTARPVWITGAGGLIGNQLIKTAPGIATIPLLRSELDLTDLAAVEKRFKTDQPSLVIHCAAISRSPDCQGNPAMARRINVEATQHLANLSADIGFVFLSSDLVFDGRKGNYVETDAQNPLSIYGETKAEAEALVLKNPRHAIARLTLCYGNSPKGHRSFNEEICDLWRGGKPARLFSDEYRCVIAAAVVARAIWEIALGKWAGVYHLAGAENLSRVQIGELLAARHPELRGKIKSCSLKEYEGAPRAADTSLNCEKLQKLLSFPLPGFTSWLEEHPCENNDQGI